MPIEDIREVQPKSDCDGSIPYEAPEQSFVKQEIKKEEGVVHIIESDSNEESEDEEDMRHLSESDREPEDDKEKNEFVEVIAPKEEVAAE